MLRCVEHVDVDARRLRSHEEWVLRHVARAVDFALVQNALVDLDLGSDRVVAVSAALCSEARNRHSATSGARSDGPRAAAGAEGPTLLAVTGVHRDVALVRRQADLGDQQVVVFVLGGVRAQQQLLLDVAVVIGPAERGATAVSARRSHSAEGRRGGESSPPFV